MTKRSQILEALGTGALTQAEIEQASGLADLKFTLGGMVKAGQVVKDARGPEGKYSAVGAKASKGPTAKKRPAKKKKAKRANKATAKSRAGGGRGTRAVSMPAAQPFRALIANGGLLVTLRDGHIAEEYSEEESQAIADALSFCYQPQQA